MSGRVSMARPMIGEEEVEAATSVLRSGALAQGEQVARFESEFSEIVGGRPCVAVNSGTSALHLSLLALGIGPGDEVIVPSFTFAATANAIRLVGAIPVFVDIEPEYFCINPELAEIAICSRTAAILCVHVYGHTADMDALQRIADRHGLALVEDAAQAHGATWASKPAGSWGAAAAFSFYPTKNMTTGEGGMIALQDAGAERLARLLRNQGMERQYENEVVGFNLRMTEVAAAIGRVQLRRLEGFNAARRKNARRISMSLDSVSSITAPAEHPQAHHVFHQYTVRSAERDGLQAHLDSHGVDARVYYPTPVHRLPAYGSSEALPETDRAVSEVLSLPVAPHLSDADLQRIIETLGTWERA